MQKQIDGNRAAKLLTRITMSIAAIAFAGTVHAAATVVTYPGPVGIPASDQFSIRVSDGARWQDSFTYQTKGGTTQSGGIDLLFRDGSTLRDSAARDLDGVRAHPSQPKGQVGQWKQIEIPIGQWLAGKVVRQVVLAFDQPGSKGLFKAVVDDVSIVQE